MIFDYNKNITEVDKDEYYCKKVDNKECLRYSVPKSFPGCNHDWMTRFRFVYLLTFSWEITPRLFSRSWIIVINNDKVIWYNLSKVSILLWILPFYFLKQKQVTARSLIEEVLIAKEDPMRIQQSTVFSVFQNHSRNQFFHFWYTLTESLYVCSLQKMQTIIWM